jgi:restriction system protein
MPRRRPPRLFPAKRRRRSGDASGLLLLLPVLLIVAYPKVALIAASSLLLVGGVIWWLRERQRRLVRQALLQLDLAGVDAMDPLRFEVFVAELLAARGYSTQLTQASHDFGVDVVASRGSEHLAVQVKHYSAAVSGQAIAEALLGMPHYGCNACMVVTNNRFTRAAVKASAPHPCTLVDRQELARWLDDARTPQG